MQTQNTPGAFGFTAPGNADPEEGGFGAYTIAAKPLKKVGLVPMHVDSRHNLPVTRNGRTRLESITCKDRRNHHRNNVRIFCMGPGCAGKSWSDEKAMAADHPSHLDMQNRSEVHLYGAWSDDPCNPPREDCADCAAATKAASEKATASAREKDKKSPELQVLVPCLKHGGGVVGLLTPADPNIPS